MNISQLISSTGKVPSVKIPRVFNRGAGVVFEKSFGEIYLYNKVVRTRKNSSIVEISMMIKAKTDTCEDIHKVMVSIRGVENKHYSAEELLKVIRQGDPTYAELEDAEILDAVITGQIKFFDNKTIFESSDGDGYNVVSNQIPYDSEIRVWCSCSDYYWTFQYYNVDNKVDIFGKYPDRYTPKTKRGFDAFKENKPLRNPGRRPGMCKHLMLLVAMLMKDDVIQSSTPSSSGENLLKSLNANFKDFQKSNRLDRASYEKLMKKYTSTHKDALNQRNMQRYDYGYGSSIGSKKTGWDKNNLKWNEPSKRWKKW